MGKNENSDLEKERKGDQKGVETRQKEKQTKACLRILSPSRSISQKFRFEILVVAKKTKPCSGFLPFPFTFVIFFIPETLVAAEMSSRVRASVAPILTSFVNNNSRED